MANQETLGAQRAVNIKYYMTTDELGPKVDPSRLEPRKGGAFNQKESATVDESAVQG